MAGAHNNASTAKRPVGKQGSESLHAFPSHFHWTSAALTNVGLVRSHNEDSFLDQPQRGLWAVADGMGGHARGDLASSMVVEALSRIQTANVMHDLIADAQNNLLAANQQLRAEAARQNVNIIGSTVVALIACGRECGYVWAGDSRIYLCRNGELAQLTRDHSQIEELKSMGHISPDMLANYPARNLITRAVGAHENLEVEEGMIEVHDDDMYLLCSDGLSNEVSEEEIVNALGSRNCQLAAEALMNLALMRGGHDNISIVVVHAEDLSASDRTALNPLV